MYRLGSTPNGVFAAKLMWNNLSWALAKFREIPRFAGLDSAEVLHAAFPDLRVIHVTRHDRVRQAVSWARMAQDGVWVVSDDEPAVPTDRPHYNFELIAGLERLIAEGEHSWRALYAELELTPYEVVYEDLDRGNGLELTIREVLDHLQVDSRDVPIPRPRTRRQADDLNEVWVTRYNEERGIKAGRGREAEAAQ